jgi:hypothetical protein
LYWLVFDQQHTTAVSRLLPVVIPKAQTSPSLAIPQWHLPLLRVEHLVQQPQLQERQDQRAQRLVVPMLMDCQLG